MSNKVQRITVLKEQRLILTDVVSSHGTLNFVIIGIVITLNKVIKYLKRIFF